MTNITYVNEGDPATPAQMNVWLNQVGGSVVVVSSFGAVGDGVTDDTNSFVSAFAEASNFSSGTGPLGGLRDGNVVYVPPGEYLISSTLSIPDGVILRGSGRVTSVIKADPTTFSAGTCVVKLGTDDEDVAFGARLEDIAVDASDITNSIGVYSSSANELSGLERVTVFSFKSSGVFFSTGTAQNYHLRDLYLIFSAAANSDAVGLDIAGGSGVFRGVDGVTVDSFSATSRYKAGVRLNAVSGGMVSRVHAESCQDAVLLGDTGDVNGTVVMGVHTGGSSACTTLVRLSNAATVQNIVVAGVQRSTGTNTLADETSSITITSNDLGLYVLGNGNSGRNVWSSDVGVGQRNSYNSIADSFTNAAGDFAERWFDNEINVNAFGLALANNPRKAYLVTNNNYELNLGLGAKIFLSHETVSSAASFSGALSTKSATALPSAVSGRGYMYADSGSSLYWVNGSGVSTLIA